MTAGTHRIAVRMRDSARSDGFDFEYEATATLAPLQSLVLGFEAKPGSSTCADQAASSAVAASCSGRRMVKVEPWPIRLSTAIAPPHLLTMP